MRGGCVATKICAADFNADGRLDLLLGDLGSEFTKVLTPEEEAQRDAAGERQAEMLAAWAEVFGQYRTLLQTPEPEQEDQRQQRQADLEALRKRLQQLNEVRSNFFREEQALIPGIQHCGHVWLFLRK